MEKDEDKLYYSAWEANDRSDFPAALEIIDTLLAEHPDSAPFWATKAVFLRDSGDARAAETAAREALRRDSNNEHAWAQLGILLAHEGRFREAADCLDRCLALDEDFNFLTIAAAIELELGNARRAAKLATRALELNSDWEEAKFLLAAAEKLISMHDDNPETGRQV